MHKIVRRAQRLVRHQRARWALAAGVFVVVLLGGLLVAGFLTSPVTDSGPPAAAAPPSAGGSASTAGTAPVNPATAGPRSGRQSAYPTEIPPAVRASLPYNPLNHLGSGDVHTVVLRVTSRADTAFGYLVPTGLTDTYGKKTTSGGTWTLRQKAVGPGHLAVVFIQADANGTPLSCRITVDGKVTSTETVSSPYAHTVCLG